MRFKLKAKGKKKQERSDQLLDQVAGLIGSHLANYTADSKVTGLLI